jgi:serine/threonine kinase 38
LEQTTVYLSLIRDKKPPHIPEVKTVWDTQNFDPYEEEEPWIPPEGKVKGRKKNP